MPSDQCVLCDSTDERGTVHVRVRTYVGRSMHVLLTLNEHKIV